MYEIDAMSKLLNVDSKEILLSLYNSDMVDDLSFVCSALAATLLLNRIPGNSGGAK
jgi:hypothetical protein